VAGGQIGQRHLDDEALIGVHLRAGPAGDHDLDSAHLLSCRECQVRSHALGTWLTALAQEADAEADVAFTPERLSQQRDRILRRLGDAAAAERPAKVLSFPIRNGAVDAPSRWGGRRLVATAAAAGLMAGLVAGSLFSLSPAGRFPRQSSSIKLVDTRTVNTTAPAAPQALPQNDETFLREIDDALSESRVEALRALDAFTPRYIDVRTPR
jgi:hypothetical protein